MRPPPRRSAPEEGASRTVAAQRDHLHGTAAIAEARVRLGDLRRAIETLDLQDGDGRLNNASDYLLSTVDLIDRLVQIATVTE